jgi:xylulokinase
MSTSLYIGIDFGTSGARAIAITPDTQIQAQASVQFNAQTTEAWRMGLCELLDQIPQDLRRHIKAIAINGTSSTVLICDEQGHPLDGPILYNDGRGVAVMEQVRAIAPPNHTVLSPTSSLAKLLWCGRRQEGRRKGEAPAPTISEKFTAKHYFLHQADWLGFLLHGQLGVSDYHNALKLGYDVGNLCYPDWMQQESIPFQLPQIVAPGTVIGTVTEAIATQFDIPPDCLVCAGTTDSIAAFLASGAQFPGEAVTSLGSTLVVKLLSKTRVDDVRYGIYSHRLGDLWLVGGASNTGGAILSQFFTDPELQRLSQQVPFDQESPLDYYPLLKPGERFPINDPNLQPRLDPRPDDPVEFLHGLLESIARIEAKGYQLLQELGATPLIRVYSAGGGAKNETWRQMRSRHLKVPVERSAQTEAAYGTALLASHFGSG